MRPPRGLSPEEAALWLRVAQTVKPLQRGPRPAATPAVAIEAKRPARPAAAIAPIMAAIPAAPRHLPPPKAREVPVRPLDRHGLDGAWERKLARAAVQPDYTLDLHGHSLDAAHARLDHGLAQAVAMGARMVLVITGKPRPVEAADRAERRGAIRAKLVDWLAHGAHAQRIAAVRGAHPRHGGSGAVYVILKKAR